MQLVAIGACTPDRPGEHNSTGSLSVDPERAFSPCLGSEESYYYHRNDMITIVVQRIAGGVVASHKSRAADVNELIPVSLSMRATAALTLTSTLLWISGALSACHPRIPSLHVELRGPTSVQDVDDLYVVTAITNTGGEAVKLARNQGTLMGKMRSDIFDITRSCGSRVSYTTYKVCVHYVSSTNTKLTGTW